MGTEVAPSLAVEFKKKYSPAHIQLTLPEVVEHFLETSEFKEMLELSEKKVKKDEKQALKVVKGGKKQRTKNPGQGEALHQTNVNSAKMKVYQNRKHIHPMRKFTAEEDKILMKHYERKGSDCFSKVAEELGRAKGTVKRRYDLLMSGLPLGVRRLFTLAEDLKILDECFKVLPRKSRLADVDLDRASFQRLAIELKKDENSIRNRFRKQLKTWLMQHYAGTLNLDIRRSLANFLVDNFENTESIDWQKVLERADFQGNGIHGIKKVFHTLQVNANHDTGIAIINLTLQDIADNANRKYGSNAKPVVIKSTLERQRKVIDCFDEFTKKNRLLHYKAC